MQKESVVLCVTGASGAIYAKTFLDIVPSLDINIECIFSEYGRRVFNYELGLKYSEIIETYSKKGIKFHEPNDMFSPLASGSILSQYSAVVVLPCSVSTLGNVANGIVNNLIHRVCDVALKEKIPLIMAVREMPLSIIHLENMVKMQKMGASAFVISPAFYNKPQKIEDLALFVVGKILDLLKVKHNLYKRWKEK